MTFDDFSLIEPIRKALISEAYSTPTPIQAESIPVALQGLDILGCAQTGTGKTAAFAIPVLQHMHAQISEDHNRKMIRTLVLTPTRELALQINESFAAYGKFLQIPHQVIFGGVPQNPQVDALRKGACILVATPGRLLDLIQQGLISLKHVNILVLDEADRMLDMGFINDVKKILAMVPQKRQTLFFSATMPPEVSKLASTILHKPVRIEVTPVSSTVDIIEQHVFFVARADKNSLLLHVLRDRELTSVLVFTRTKHGADKTGRFLSKNKINASVIHGDKTQNNRQRALEQFRSGQSRVLVASDIAARGLDIEGISAVVNMDIPEVPETYVHRIGRTGRAGKNGISFSFCDLDEKPLLRDIEKLTGRKIPVNASHPWPLDEARSAEEIRRRKEARDAEQKRRTAAKQKSKR